MIIAVEGPAGSGKSTMAKTVAAELSIPVAEGGAWYRALTFFALQKNIKADDTERLIEEASKLSLNYEKNEAGVYELKVHGASLADLYEEHVSVAIAPIAQNIAVRKVIEPLIAKAVRGFDAVIIVGRHIRRSVPEARVLRITIDSAEAERRHGIRAGEKARSVAARNETDKVTARLLGSTEEGVTLLDVTNLTQKEQADALRGFIANQK